jgi:hypothetical protein
MMVGGFSTVILCHAQFKVETAQKRTLGQR